MRRTVVGTFEDAEPARRGVDRLMKRGLAEDLEPVKTDETGRVLVTLRVPKDGVEDAREALLAAGAIAVAVDAKVS